MHYAPYLFVLFPSFQKKDPLALMVVQMDHCYCDFDVGAVAGVASDFYDNVAGAVVVAVAAPFLVFLFRKTVGTALFPPVGSYSLDHHRDRHSFVEFLLPGEDHLFLLQLRKPPKSSLVHVEALLVLVLPKTGDHNVDY